LRWLALQYTLDLGGLVHGAGRTLLVAMIQPVFRRA